jgi:hypothetical protein
VVNIPLAGPRVLGVAALPVCNPGEAAVAAAAEAARSRERGSLKYRANLKSPGAVYMRGIIRGEKVISRGGWLEVAILAGTERGARAYRLAS